MLSTEHTHAIRRRRRLIFHHDVGAFFVHDMDPGRSSDVADYFLSAVDETSNQIDSVWYDWGAGDRVPYESDLLPPMVPAFLKWWEAGVDPVRLLLDAARERGREVFYSFRINVDYPLQADGDHGWAMPTVEPKHPDLVKENHPDWLIYAWAPLWNFEVEEVRDLKVRILKEVADRYEFDGIHLDFARNAVLFPPGTQWENRDRLTDFIRRTRSMLLEIEKTRGRPFLLAARIPDNLMGCHFDGMDVERWAREKLVDIFVLGSRSSEVDLPAFRRIIEGTDIRLYPCWTDHHSSHGYAMGPPEVLRGVYANWWQQGADGAYSFNFMSPSPQAATRLGLPPSDRWEVQRMLFQEIGSPDRLRHRDKVFFVQRRGGGHAPYVVPDPDDWETPRHTYLITNMLAPLPAPLDNDGRVDTLLTLNVADDVNAASDSIREIVLKLALSDPAARSLNDEERLESIPDSKERHPIRDMPPALGIEKQIDVRLNNLLLAPARVERGWLVFPVQPRQLAVGKNLVGVNVTDRPADAADPMRIEKLELHVRYR